MSLVEHARHIAKDFTPARGHNENNEEYQHLADRLDAGWAMCDREPDPAQRDRLETFWIDLLRRYEQAVDRLNDRHNQREAA
jgi:hypothetical protein